MSEEIKRGNGKEYTSASFESHEGLDGIRVRPTVYIGSIGPEGTFRIFLEGFGNVIDEFNAGRCTGVNITVDSSSSSFTVEDNALGIPIEAFKGALTKVHTGGKFGKSTYDYSLGLNGIGLKAINALSDDFTVDTWYRGKHGHFHSEKSIEKDYWIKDDKNHKSGTLVKWHPDITVLEDISLNFNKYASTLEMNSYINEGFDINLVWDGKLFRFCHPEGMQGYFVQRILKGNKIRALSQPIIFTANNSIKNEKTGKTINMAYKVFFTWGENVKSEVVESYVNGLKTMNGGTHVTGVHMALTKALKDYIDNNGLLPKNSKITIDGNDIRETLVLLVVANHSAPQYTTQIKDAMENKDIQFFMSSSIYKSLQTWLTDNSKIANEICKLAIRSAKARAAAKAAKDNIIKAGGKISTVSVNPKKFNGCKSNKPEECELYIVEGDSAGGSAKDARNTDNQAVFRIRGKIQNVLKQQNPTLADELVMLIDILGCGYGPTFDINKLRFHKIIKAADADSDGDHISTLIDGFFFKMFPQIIEAGYLYEAKPPLYQLTFGKGASAKSVFIPNQFYFQKAISSIATGAFNLITFSGIELSKELSELYISKMDGFKDFLESYSKQICVDPELLEFIVRFYKDLTKCNFKPLENLGWDVTIVAKGDSYLHLNFDKDYDHYFVVLDSRFYESIYRPITKKLEDIHLMNVKFKGKNTGECYGGTTYRNAQFLNELLMGKGIAISRLKGLGESDADELRYYMFNEKTRVINKIRMNDIEEAGKAFDIFLGNNIEGKKKMFLEQRDVTYESDD